MRILIPISAITVATAVAALAIFHPAARTAASSPPAAVSSAPASAWSTVAPSAAPASRRSTPSPPARAVVYVTGAIVRPGVYSLDAGARLGDALARAGGGRPDADLVAVNLAAHLRDGDEIVVPVRGAAPVLGESILRSDSAVGVVRADDAVRGDAASRGAEPSSRPGRAAGAHRGRRGHGARSSGRSGSHRGQRADEPPPAVVDLNHADAATLETLPGIGPALADRIIAFREVNGPFTSPDELLDVSGVTPRRLDEISPYVVVR